MIVTLTDYNEATAHVRPGDRGRDPGDGGDPPPPRGGRRRLVPRATTWTAWTSTGRRSRPSSARATATFVEELARRLHHDGRLIAVDVYPKTREPGGWDGPRAQDWRRLGPGRRPVPRHDLQLLRLVVRARPALAARVDGRGARLRRDAGQAAQDRHGHRLLRPRLARRPDHRPGVGETSQRIRAADKPRDVARPLGRAHALVQPGRRRGTRRSSRTPRRSTPSC